MPIPYVPFTPIGRYVDFSPATWVIPSTYWDAISPEQRYHCLCKMLSKLATYADYLGIEIDDLGKMYETLVSDFKKFQESGFDDYYLEQVKAWIDAHLTEIYRYTIGQIFFSVDDSGYLIAHVPVGWEQIRFSTPMDYADQTTYGRLCLTYAFDAELEV